MKTLMKFSRGLSRILLLSLLMVYGGKDVHMQAESPVDISLTSTAGWWSDEWGESRGIAWGDVDSDGDLDLAVANANNEATHVYINIDGVLENKASWSTAEVEAAYSVAWGDVDGDGDLDLAVGNVPEPEAEDSRGKNRVYLNHNGKLDQNAAWSSAEGEETYSILWGDVDNDGDLDLAVGNKGANRVYLNKLDLVDINENAHGIHLEETASWFSEETAETRRITWGDLNNDGYLDLAAGNRDGPNHIYLNVKGRLQEQTLWQSDEADKTQSIAWADVNNDGYLDLMAGNDGENRLYLNQKGRLEREASWVTEEKNNTYDVSWGDLDGDGDLDLAIANGASKPGNELQSPANQLYINVSGALQATDWLSDEGDNTYSLAWGDVDGDDDLDLAVGSGAVRRIYYNEGNVLLPTPAWSDSDRAETTSVAWGDMDGDGDLDLAVGDFDRANRVYMNQNGALQSAVWVAAISDKTTSIAWGDIDGDDDLDLAVGNKNEVNYVYENLGNILAVDPIWVSDEEDNTTSIAWGDMDSDGDLDLAVGNGFDKISGLALNRVYTNSGTILEKNASWPSDLGSRIDDEDITYDIAWGDLDGDGDLDLAVGNGGVNRIYRNENNILKEEPFWSSAEEDRTRSVAWGDVDNDGDLDLAVGNEEEPNRIYLNDGEILQPTAYWSSLEADHTNILTWGDVNGDGNLDLAVGNYSEVSRVYINLDGRLQERAAWKAGETDKTTAVAWGDMDNDGDLDLAVGNEGNNQVYVGKTRQSPQAESAYIHIEMPSATQNLQSTEIGASADTTFLTTPANFYATTRVWETTEIPIAYKLFDPGGKPARFVEGFYSLDGGGNWLRARPITYVQESAVESTVKVNNTYLGSYTGIKKTEPNTLDVQPASVPKNSVGHRLMLPLVMNNGPKISSEPVNHAFVWDTLANSSVGQSDNVVFRLEAHLSGTNSFQRATVGAQTYPFRVRSPLQPRVQTETGTNIADALVYRLPQGQSQGAKLFANNRGTPYHTDLQ